MNPALYRIGIFCWCMAVCGLFTGCRNIHVTDHDLVFQEVFYLTVREQSGSNNPGDRFSNKRGTPVYGMAMLALRQGDAFTDKAVAQPNRVLQQSQRTHASKVQHVTSFPKSGFISHVQDYSITGTPVEEILIYIHGFRRDFADSVTNAAKLRHELAFPGPVIAFSWPSNTMITGYLSDMENVDWSAPQLRHMVKELANALPLARIHVVAHSIGNRALTKTLIDLYQDSQFRENWPLGEIIMLAPDLDRARFIDETSRQLDEIPSRITLYVSDSDFPLMTAAQVFHYPRLGDSRTGAPILPGIETIDVSDAINITSGHGYYEESPMAIEDLYHLIHDGQSAAERPHMKEVQTDEGTYWRLQPATGKLK